jgi:hypothetical protein
MSCEIPDFTAYQMGRRKQAQSLHHEWALSVRNHESYYVRERYELMISRDPFCPGLGRGTILMSESLGYDGCCCCQWLDKFKMADVPV